MRVIGEIKHPKYKITILKMNEKISIQIEDRLVSQSYTFRDGSGVNDMMTVEQVLTPKFMKDIDVRFNQMNADYIEALEKLNTDDFDDFEII